METYQPPEAVEIGKADEMILGPKEYELWDGYTYQFDTLWGTIVDVDE